MREKKTEREIPLALYIYIRSEYSHSSHKGSKFRYAIVRKFSRGDERIREDIPVPDSLGKEAFLVGIFTSRGNLKDH